MRTRQDYITILRAHANELQQRFGITYLRLFGSVARDQHTNHSDVDLIRKHSNMRPFFLDQIQKYGIDIFGKA